jgi:hypothetical protein
MVLHMNILSCFFFRIFLYRKSPKTALLRIFSVLVAYHFSKLITNHCPNESEHFKPGIPNFYHFGVRLIVDRSILIYYLLS